MRTSQSKAVRTGGGYYPTGLVNARRLVTVREVIIVTARDKNIH